VYSRFTLRNKNRNEEMPPRRNKTKANLFYRNGVEILKKYCRKSNRRKIPISKAKQRENKKRLNKILQRINAAQNNRVPGVL
jgi:hypothetical protein